VNLYHAAREPYRAVRGSLNAHLKKSRFTKLYSKFHDLTMMPEHGYVNTLRLAETAINLTGCIVECGVWRGGTAAGILSVLGTNRKIYLFDSFEGLPPAREIDGPAALQYQKNTDSPLYLDNCSAPQTYAEKAMALAGASDYEIKKGWFTDTLPRFVPCRPIAVLHLDADWYESIFTCLECLFDWVMPEGVIIIDDYYVWDGCSRATHDYLSKRSATERIREFGGVCYLRKRSSI
jgi:O-methyltransferase